MLVSCAEEKHDFVYGEYKEMCYLKGELQDGISSDIFNGTVFNDTLYLTYSNYHKFGGNKSCAIDTSYYLKQVLAIPLIKRYDELLWTTKSISTSHWTLSKNDPPTAIRVDTCIRKNNEDIIKFSVTEDYIELVFCPYEAQDCPLEEAAVTHFIRPIKSEQTKD